MTSEELWDVRGWCCDMRDLAIANRSPITMYAINNIDNMTVDRMKTGCYKREQDIIVQYIITNIPGLTRLL